MSGHWTLQGREHLARGNQLIERWEIPARQALFHRDRTFYEHLTRFPGALCDPALRKQVYADADDCDALRATAGIPRGSTLSSSMAGVALRDRVCAPVKTAESYMKSTD